MRTNFETIGLERCADNVLLATLDRPAASNAINTQMGFDLLEIFENIALEPEANRCVILTGRGAKSFCAGADLKERRTMTDREWRTQHLVFERMIRAIMACPTPVIAAVNGAAYGGGCEMAAVCDFIYASDNARFALTEVSLGIIPGCGGTQTLGRAVGERRAKELILTALPFSASEAEAWGLVNRVLPQTELLEGALSTACRIANNAPLAVRQAKQSIHCGMQMSLSDGLAFEIEAYNRTVGTDDRREGVLAFSERRKPIFQDR